MTERIVLLGGGIGSLTTAFFLTQQPDWQQRYTLTLYQLGWRLGGKGASGVNLRAHGRIEEHGLHVWFGFYQNAFRMMRECYDALDRPPDHPLATAAQAFTPIHDHTFLEQVDDGWMPWSYRFRGDGVLPGAPATDGLPETVPTLPGVWGCASRVLSWVRLLLQEHPRLRWLARPDGSGWLPGRPPWRRAGAVTTAPGGAAIIDLVEATLRRVLARPGGALAPAARRVARLRDRLCGWLREDTDPGVQRLRVMLDLSLTGVVGLLADEVPRRGYRSIDGEDFRDWLRRHGAHPEAADAPIVRTLYDIFFAYEGGDTEQPAVAAGATLRGMFRLLFSYHGAVLWKMNAGMGDAIIAPLYTLLARRGVRFRFFHAVEGLELSDDGRDIARIRLRQQATVRAGAGAYAPLVTVRGLECWPTAPLWDQLDEADDGSDLERLAPGQGTPRCLRQGEDFDRVVLGISVGALPALCGELAAARPAWRDMLRHLKTVRTQALQLWLTPPHEALGSQWPSGMVASYVQPFSSWSDFSQVLCREEWPAGAAPQHLAYSCGVLPDAPEGPPDDERAADVVRETVAAWLPAHGPVLWPALADGTGRFRWELLYDPQQRSGAARVEAQYVRANTHPTERYVLALPGTTRYRLPPGGSGFDNLVLAGAWTDNHYTLSCIEATVMSGMMAARALDGRPRRIVGEGDE